MNLIEHIETNLSTQPRIASNEYSKHYRHCHTAIYVGNGAWKVTDKFHPRGWDDENH